MVATAALLFLTGSIPTRASSELGAVAVWGSNANGETNLPGGLLTNVVAVAAGGVHTLALLEDTTVVAWESDSSERTNVPQGLSNVVAIAAGGSHSVALRSNGTVVAWGGNSHGQTDLPVFWQNVKAISAGSSHSLFLFSNGALEARGMYYTGGTWLYMNAVTPVGLTSVVNIASGGHHALALKANGTVIAFGWNSDGQTNVPSTLSNVVAIAAGHSESLALKADGTVVAWGRGRFVPPTLTNAVEIAAGQNNYLTRRADGTLVGWGDNDSGQATIPHGLSGVAAISAGYHHSVAITLVPVIVAKPPNSISLAPAADTNLSVAVWSGSPFKVWWTFANLPMPGGTNTSLAVSNFSVGQAGRYALTVSNQHGQATATSVLRLLNSPVILVDGEDVGGGTATPVDSVSITMSNTGTGEFIYYTLGGGDPDFTDTPYTGTFTLTKPATIRAVAYNSAFTESAEAAPITVQVTPSYPLTLSTSGGGSVDVSQMPYSGNRYVSNTLVTVTAAPDPGWEFMNWTGDSTATTNVINLTMNGPLSLSAVFGTSPQLYTNGNGSLVLYPSGGPYPYGSSLQATALPTPGNYFFGWAGALNGFHNRELLVVTNATPNITALFAAMNTNQVSLTVLPEGNGTVSVSPSANVYTNGENVTLTALPGTGSQFSSWSGDAAGTFNPLVITLDSSKLITATFEVGSPTDPPVITRSPLSRTLSAGSSTLLSFELTGDGPFSYEWRLNGSPLVGGVAPTFALSNFQVSDVGLYDVAVFGSSGAATSAPASLALFGMELVISAEGISPLLTLDGAPGTSCQLEHSPGLLPTNWNLLLPVTLSGEHFYYVDDPITNHPMRFYRAVPE